MATYKLEKTKTEKKLSKKKIVVNGLTMNPKFKNHPSLVKVEEIIIVNQTLKEKVLKVQFNVAFRKLLRLVMDVSEGGSDTDIGLAINETEKMKKILKEKYEKEIDAIEFHRMWQKAELLESDLRRKLVEQRKLEELFYRQNMPYEWEEERGRGR